MSVTRGTRLGSYEILDTIGSGGMGEVYRARDTKLGRDVAIKVLPEDLASDPERLRRFEQEAQSASALNHPNIITIYDIGEEASLHYIAMELVDGKTLREILSDGPLPFRRLLALASQAADGLAKAHAAGIVHCDLKPENLMVTEDGFVKILDFGTREARSRSQRSEFANRVRAIELDPSSSPARHRYANYLWTMKRLDEAAEHLEKAQDLDPLSLMIAVDRARTHYFSGEYDRAVEGYQEILALDPNFHRARLFVGISYEHLEMYGKAVAEIAAVFRRAGANQTASAIEKAYAESGDLGALRAWADSLKAAPRGGAQPTSIAMIYCRLGDKERAFEFLEQGYQERTRGLVYLQVEPQYDPIRSDPRFQDMLARMNFPK